MGQAAWRFHLTGDSLSIFSSYKMIVNVIVLDIVFHGRMFGDYWQFMFSSVGFILCLQIEE